LPFWHDHFVCPGAVSLDLAAGEYTYECERGPEYTLRKGSFTVADKGPVKLSDTAPGQTKWSCQNDLRGARESGPEAEGRSAPRSFGPPRP
jgi:hypothetical protein